MRSHILGAGILACLCHMAFGQTQNTNVNQLEKEPLRGIVPTGMYAFSDIETIGIASGNLMMNIPLANLPAGRGGMSGPGIGLQYNSKSWQGTATVHRVWSCSGGPPALSTTYTTYSLNSFDAWRYAGYGYVFRATPREEHFVDEVDPLSGGCNLPQPDPCSDVGVNLEYRRWKYEVEFPDGGVHTLVPVSSLVGQMSQDGYYSATPDGHKLTCVLSGGQVQLFEGPLGAPLSFATVDGTYARLDLNAADEGDWILTFTDGRQVRNKVAGAGGQRVYDRNGDYYEAATYCTSAANCSTRTTMITDSVGRSITLQQASTLSSGANTYTDTLSASGFGETLTWSIEWGVLTSTYQYQPFDLGVDSQRYPNQALGTLIVVQKITLPTQLGGLSYTFDYHKTRESGSSTAGTGVLRGVTLPTTASARYMYAIEDCPQTSCLGQGVVTFQTVLDNSPTSKTLTCPDCPAPSQPYTETWNYTLPNHLSGAATVTGPDGSTTTYLTARGLTFRTTYPDGSTMEQLWSQSALKNIGACTVGNATGCRMTWIGGPLPDQYAVPWINPFVSADYRTLTGSQTRIAIRQFSQDQNGNTTTEFGFGFSTTSVGRNTSTDNQPNDTGNAIGVRTRSTTYNSTAVADQACSHGAYCDSTAQRILSEIRSQSVVGGGSSAYSEYCYDANGNRTLEAHGAAAGLTNCTSGTATASALAYTAYSYDAYGNQTQVSPGTSAPMIYTYGDVGRAGNLYWTQMTRASQTTQRYYDFNSGVVIEETDPNQVTTSTHYDAVGRPDRVTRDSERTVVSRSDSERYAVLRTDQALDSSDGALGRALRFDSLGRPSLIQQTETATDAAAVGGDPTLGIKTRHLYWNGRVSCGSLYGASLEAVSNPYRTSSDGTAGWTRTCHDNMGRVIEVMHFDGSSQPAPWGTNASSSGSSTITYDGPQSTVTDEAGKQRASIVDALGRLESVKENPNGASPYPYTTSYTYDALGGLTAVSQSGQSRTFAYDALGRLVCASNPERRVASVSCAPLPASGVDLFSYDVNGNLSTRKDARSIQTGFQYDTLNRVTSKTYSDGTPQVRYYYDGNIAGVGPISISGAAGRLTSVTNSVSTTNYTGYDSSGRVLSSEQITGSAPAYTFSYSYNAAGELISETYPSQRTINVNYDQAGRISQVNGSKSGSSKIYAVLTSDPTVQDYAYAPHGGILKMTLGTTTTRLEQSCYNSRLQMVGFRVGSAVSAACGVLSSDPLNLTLSYASSGNNGDLQSQTTTRLGQAWTNYYTYDPLDRLNCASEGVACGSAGAAWSQAYSYDAWGNRAVSGSIPNPWATPTALAQYTNNKWYPQNGESYDEAGNQTGLALRTYGYDAESRLTGTVGPNIGAISYGYDGEGRRITKVICADASPCVATASGAKVTTYVYDAGGRMVAEYGPVASSGTYSASFLTGDHLGSTRMVMDSSGSVKEDYDYYPFGEDIAAGTGGRPSLFSSGTYPNSPDALPQKFTGKERDAETGLDYFGARYYSGAQGRFTSPDQPFVDQNPADPQSWNLYAYGRNNPLRYIDPLGTCTKAADAKQDTPADSICADPSTLKASGKLIETIKANEDTKVTAYIAPEGFNADGTKNGRGLTVGIGHLVTAADNLNEGDKITPAQVTAFLAADLDTSATGVRQALGKTEVSQREFDALIDLSFNAGPNIFAGSPRLNIAIGSANYDAMGNELRYTRANGMVLPGLVNRSDQRQNVFRHGNYDPVTRRR